MSKENLQIKVSNLTNSPGVYQFFDDSKKIIYVGKAKNLRKRVATYFGSNTSWKIKRLVNEAKEISFVVSQNEANALLAEYSFIQEFRPKYNVQFKDDKSYPYVTISNDLWPRVYVSRNINKKNTNFGPYPFIGAARRSVDHLINIFPVRTCSNNTFENHKKLKKPCLLYEIDKCSGPCVDYVDQGKYTEMIDNIKEFYKGNSDIYINEKIQEMKYYSDNQQYEDAQKTKNIIPSILNIMYERYI